MATRIASILLAIALLGLANTAIAQVTSDSKDLQVAKKTLQLRTRQLDSIVTTITSLCTDRMSPSAKAVYDYVQANIGGGGGSGGHVLAGNGSAVSAKDTADFRNADIAWTVSNTSTATRITANIAPDSVGSTELASTAVTPGTYGSATQSAQVTVDADGRITSASNVTISGVAPADGDKGDVDVTASGATWTVDTSAVTTIKIADDAVTAAKIAAGAVDASELASTAVTPGTYGSATQSPQVTVDADGRITGASNVTISGVAPADGDKGDVDVTSSGATWTVDTSAVTSLKIADGTIATADIAASAVTATELASNAVTAAKIATGAVTSTGILDGTIAAADLGQMGASSGQVMKWNGSAWVAANDSINTGTLTGSGTATQVATWSGAGSLTGSNTMAYETNTLSLYPSADDTLFKAEKNGGYFGLQTLVDPHNGSQNAYLLGGLKGDTRWWMKGYETYIDVPLRAEQSTGIEFRGSSGSLFLHPDGDHYNSSMGGDNGSASRNFHWYYSSGGTLMGNPMVFHQVFSGNDTLYNSFDFLAECPGGITFPDSNLFRVGNKDRGTALNVLQNRNVGLKTNTPAYSLDISATDGIRLPIGTTAQRPAGTPSGVLRYNSDSTGVEIGTGSGWTKLGGGGGGGGTGDINNGGNTTGATVTIGTNDANDLALETNNVTRASITGGASTGGAWTATDVTSNTNSVETMHTNVVNSSGTAATGLGYRSLYQLESSTTNAQNAAALDVLWSDGTHGTRTADFVFSTVSSANAIAEMLRLGGTTYALTATAAVSNTNTVADRLIIKTNSTGTAATSFGAGINFQLESSTTDNRDAANIAGYWVNATDASRTGGIWFRSVNNAGALSTMALLSPASAGGTVTMRFGGGTTAYSDAGITIGGSYTLGGSSSTLTLGGNTGGLVFSTTSTSTSAISISPGSTSSTSAAGISIYPGSNLTQTSGTRNILDFGYGFAPTSGTAVHNQLTFTGTFNQTGGASGITRGIYLNQTITAVADFRAIEIAANGSNVKGLYQSGTSATNNLAGATAFGTTSAPNSKAIVEFSSTTKGVLLPRMTSTERDAISSPPAGLLIFNTTTTKMECYDGSTWQAAW